MLAKAVVPQETKKRWQCTLITTSSYFTPLHIIKYTFIFSVSVFPFMRRQRHSSPSPAQAVAQATEEDGRARQTGQAGTNSAAGAHVWYWGKSTRQTQSPPSPLSLLVTIATAPGVPPPRFAFTQTVKWKPALFVSTAAALPEDFSAELPLGANLGSVTSYSQSF